MTYSIWIEIEADETDELEAETVHQSKLCKSYKTELEAVEAANQFEHDTFAMEQIQSIMSGKNWTPDTLDDIATIVRRTGREIVDPE